MNAGLFFPLSKAAWFAMAPSHLILWLAVATVVAIVTRQQRTARWLSAATVALFVTLGVLPVGAWLARPLENAYPRPDPPPAHVDGIITLGGGLDTQLVLARGGAPAAASSLPRLVATFALARQHPEARVVFAGGWGMWSDSKAAGIVFDQMGLDPARLTLEDKSRNTFQNLTNARGIVRPKPGETWMLATSALQMPRAMAVARSLHWQMTPWPTDYLTSPNFNPRELLAEPNLPGRLALVDASVHEWLGLLVYNANGMGRR